LDATGPDQAFEAPSHPKCSRSIPAILFGAAAPNECDLSPSTREHCFRNTHSFWAIVQALGYPISGTDDELRIGRRGATILPGIALRARPG
jgi:hypothetical protein